MIPAHQPFQHPAQCKAMFSTHVNYLHPYHAFDSVPEQGHTRAVALFHSYTTLKTKQTMHEYSVLKLGWKHYVSGILRWTER